MAWEGMEKRGSRDAASVHEVSAKGIGCLEDRRLQFFLDGS